MIARIISITVISFLLSSSNPPEEDDFSYTIGISDFLTQGADANQQWIGNSCIDAITVRLSGQKNIKIVERKYLSKIIEEIKLQASGLVDENTAVELGNLVAVKYFIFGSASVSGDNLVVRARIIDVSTSKVINASEVSGTINEVFKLQQNLSNQIAAALGIGNLDIDKQAISNSETLSYSAISKLEKIKKMADQLPFFTLDAARKRKATEYMLAINLCDDLLEKYPNLSTAHYYKGLFSIQLEELSTADIETKEAKKLEPGNQENLVCRGFYFFVAGKYEAAQQLLEYAIIAFPNDARFRYALAKVCMEQNQNEKAIENFMLSLSLSPDIPNVEANLKALITTVNFSPNQFSDHSFYDVALLYKVLYSDKPIISTSLYELAKRIISESKLFAVPFYVMGLYEQYHGNVGIAFSHFQNAIKLKATYSEAHRELGVLLLKSRKCNSGKQHIMLYLQTSQVITDAGELHARIRNCN
ncbi:FlgO family outer membrane protein [Aurantibacillus circumpalustris]|uniref:FlgO family outer membrane protein n=1 Tax=Aurantibacillus circumpalustris TaxID=3036359 RepID=UPI00295B60CC|nr:FlgO family outer membrane protein [Aurantibacillus circumpalustris]